VNARRRTAEGRNAPDHGLRSRGADQPPGGAHGEGAAGNPDGKPGPPALRGARRGEAEPAHAQDEYEEVDVGKGHVGEAAAVDEAETEAGRGADEDRQERVGEGGGFRVRHG
jgi:hypothetical protein